MSDKSYNGWTNYETWNVALWIDNEPSTYEERCDMAKGASGVYELSEELQSWVEGMAPDLGASLFSDLLNAALSEVNWYEIAEKWYAEAHEDDEPEVEEPDPDREEEPLPPCAEAMGCLCAGHARGADPHEPCDTRE